MSYINVDQNEQFNVRIAAPLDPRTVGSTGSQPDGSTTAKPYTGLLRYQTDLARFQYVESIDNSGTPSYKNLSDALTLAATNMQLTTDLLQHAQLGGTTLQASSTTDTVGNRVGEVTVGTTVQDLINSYGSVGGLLAAMLDLNRSYVPWSITQPMITILPAGAGEQVITGHTHHNPTSEVNNTILTTFKFRLGDDKVVNYKVRYQARGLDYTGYYKYGQLKFDGVATLFSQNVSTAGPFDLGSTTANITLTKSLLTVTLAGVTTSNYTLTQGDNSQWSLTLADDPSPASLLLVKPVKATPYIDQLPSLLQPSDGNTLHSLIVENGNVEVLGGGSNEANGSATVRDIGGILVNQLVDHNDFFPVGQTDSSSTFQHYGFDMYGVPSMNLTVQITFEQGDGSTQAVSEGNDGYEISTSGGNSGNLILGQNFWSGLNLAANEKVRLVVTNTVAQVWDQVGMQELTFGYSLAPSTSPNIFNANTFDSSTNVMSYPTSSLDKTFKLRFVVEAMPRKYVFDPEDNTGDMASHLANNDPVFLPAMPDTLPTEYIPSPREGEGSLPKLEYHDITVTPNEWKGCLWQFPKEVHGLGIAQSTHIQRLSEQDPTMIIDATQFRSLLGLNTGDLDESIFKGLVFFDFPSNNISYVTTRTVRVYFKSS